MGRQRRRVEGKGEQRTVEPIQNGPLPMGGSLYCFAAVWIQRSNGGMIAALGLLPEPRGRAASEERLARSSEMAERAAGEGTAEGAGVARREEEVEMLRSGRRELEATGPRMLNDEEGAARG